MHSKTTRVLLSTLATLTLAGGVAACGDDTSTTGNTAMPMNSPAAASATTPEGVDEAFVRQMIPHHEMAVVMAKAAQKQAEHQEIKDLADAIITAQEKEIAELQAIAKKHDWKVADYGPMMDGDATMMGMSMDDMGMSMNADDLDGADDFDKAFITMMIPHHEGAIAMAKAQLARGADAELDQLSEGIITAQEKEIAEMKSWYEDWYGEPVSESSAGMGEMDHMGH